MVGLERTMAARRSATHLLEKHEEDGAADLVLLNGPSGPAGISQFGKKFCCYFASFSP